MFENNLSEQQIRNLHHRFEDGVEIANSGEIVNPRGTVAGRITFDPYEITYIDEDAQRSAERQREPQPGAPEERAGRQQQPQAEEEEEEVPEEPELRAPPKEHATLAFQVKQPPAPVGLRRGYSRQFAVSTSMGSWQIAPLLQRTFYVLHMMYRLAREGDGRVTNLRRDRRGNLVLDVAARDRGAEVSPYCRAWQRAFLEKMTDLYLQGAVSAIRLRQTAQAMGAWDDDAAARSLSEGIQAGLRDFPEPHTVAWTPDARILYRLRDLRLPLTTEELEHAVPYVGICAYWTNARGEFVGPKMFKMGNLAPRPAFEDAAKRRVFAPFAGVRLIGDAAVLLPYEGDAVRALTNLPADDVPVLRLSERPEGADSLHVAVLVDGSCHRLLHGLGIKLVEDFPLLVPGDVEEVGGQQQPQGGAEEQKRNDEEGEVEVEGGAAAAPVRDWRGPLAQYTFQERTFALDDLQRGRDMLYVRLCIPTAAPRSIPFFVRDVDVPEAAAELEPGAGVEEEEEDAGLSRIYNAIIQWRKQAWYAMNRALVGSGLDLRTRSVRDYPLARWAEALKKTLRAMDEESRHVPRAVARASEELADKLQWPPQEEGADDEDEEGTIDPRLYARDHYLAARLLYAHLHRRLDEDAPWEGRPTPRSGTGLNPALPLWRWTGSPSSKQKFDPWTWYMRLVDPDLTQWSLEQKFRRFVPANLGYDSVPREIPAPSEDEHYRHILRALARDSPGRQLGHLVRHARPGLVEEMAATIHWYFDREDVREHIAAAWRAFREIKEGDTGYLIRAFFMGGLEELRRLQADAFGEAGNEILKYITPRAGPGTLFYESLVFLGDLGEQRPNEGIADWTVGRAIRNFTENIVFTRFPDELVFADVPRWLRELAKRHLGYTGDVFAAPETAAEGDPPETQQRIIARLLGTPLDDARGLSEELVRALAKHPWWGLQDETVVRRGPMSYTSQRVNVANDQEGRRVEFLLIAPWFSVDFARGEAHVFYPDEDMKSLEGARVGTDASGSVVSVREGGVQILYHELTWEVPDTYWEDDDPDPRPARTFAGLAHPGIGAGLAAWEEVA